MGTNIHFCTQVKQKALSGITLVEPTSDSYKSNTRIQYYSFLRAKKDFIFPFTCIYDSYKKYCVCTYSHSAKCKYSILQKLATSFLQRALRPFLSILFSRYTHSTFLETGIRSKRKRGTYTFCSIIILIIMSMSKLIVIFSGFDVFLLKSQLKKCFKLVSYQLFFNICILCTTKIKYISSCPVLSAEKQFLYILCTRFFCIQNMCTIIFNAHRTQI